MRIVIKLVSVFLLGICCALFALLLKTTAEGVEHYVLSFITKTSIWLVFIAPTVGLLFVFLITKNIFKMPINGIREIINALNEPTQALKPIKAILHFFTGFFTIVFGGSTGIEVSTVVASSATGSWLGQTFGFNEDFKKKLIIAGAAAGMAGLFKSPLAGLFFAAEVLMVGFSWEVIGYAALAAGAAFGANYLYNSESMFHVELTGWRWGALPYYIIFSLVAAYFSVLLTRGVIQLKEAFARRMNPVGRVLIGGIILGTLLLLFIPLYGEGYTVIQELLSGADLTVGFTGVSGIMLLAILLFLKPIATSVTLASGGDGGIFAPSMVVGAIAGCLFAQGVRYFGGPVVEVNFILIGMAAVLSASLHAPLTSAFLIMSIIGNYELFVPIMLTSFLASELAKRIYPFTVYSYAAKPI